MERKNNSCAVIPFVQFILPIADTPWFEAQRSIDTPFVINDLLIRTH